MKVPVHFIMHVEDKAYDQFMKHVENDEEAANTLLIRYEGDFTRAFHEFIVHHAQETLSSQGILTERIYCE